MTTQTQRRKNQRARRRVQPKRNTSGLLIGVVALIVLLLGGLALIGLQANQASNDVRVATHGAPPNAEPNGRAWGPRDAPITVIEYADYECESCGYFAANYEQEFVRSFAATGKVRFEIRYAPFHGEGAQNAAQAASCAADQNMFWPMHDSMFLNQPAHGASVEAGFSVARLTSIAEKLNMDAPVLNQCLVSGKYKQQVQDALLVTQQNNITGTPTFVVNGTPYTGPMSVAQFRQVFAEVAPDVTFE